MGLKTSANKTWKEQAKKLLPATFKKAIVTAVYSTNYTVDIYIVGNNQTIIRNIPLASSVDITNVAQGDRCRVDMFSETNPNDMVVAYIYGKPQNKKSNSGTTSIISTGSGTTVPHGLGVVPSIVSIILNATGTVFQTAPADSVNLYLKAATGTISITWYVAKI